MNELLEQFLTEGRELVQQATDDLLALERDPADAARLDEVFRAVHTLKGAVALFDLLPMGRALHAAEDLLEALRSRRLSAGRAEIDALLGGIAATEAWLEDIARDGALPSGATARAETLTAALQACLPSADRVAEPMTTAPAWLPALLAREAATRRVEEAAGQRLTALRYQPAADCFFLGDDPLALVRTVPGLVALHLSPREPWPATGPEAFTCNLVIELLSTAPSEALRQVFRFVSDQVELAAVPPAAMAASAPPEFTAGSLRVDPSRVDRLLDLAGEMIISRNRLAHLVGSAGVLEPALARALNEGLARIERLAEAVHGSVMDLRMVPLGRTLRRFPRMLRETASQLGKEVTLEMSGEAVRADRAVVDGLFEPLLHVLRNAIDHGIELPAVRTRAGKAATGRIALTARRAAEGIVVEVADDGSGIDPARLRQVAKQRQMLDAAAIDALDDAAAMGLLFLPGFSTAATVTAVSGRGVGMDAVRRAVEALGGQLELRSTPGAGTALTVMVPQRAAVTNLLTVRVGDEVLGIPTEAVAEIVRLPADRILPLQHREAFVLRDRTVPLLQLKALIGLPPRPRKPGSAAVLVTGTGRDKVGLEVDAIVSQIDVLVRPLDGLLAGLPAVTGTALLGDGRVLVVLDIAELLG